MGGEWQAKSVAEVASGARNALVGGPFGSNLVSRDYVSEGVPVIRGQNMSGRWVSGEFVFVTAEKADSLEANLARPGDIVFTQRGTLGQVALVPESPFVRYLVSQSQMKLTVNEEVATPLFLYYQFTSPSQQDYIRQHAIQVGVPHTNLGILRDTPVLVPPLDEQRAIAHILGTLDDKIELNRRMNETLEVIARTIFQSWFVDFDPVRAKVSGEPPESICRRLGLTPDLLALFPDRLVDSELGEIPEGWGVSPMGNVCKRVAMGPFGSDIKKSNFVSAGVPVIRGGNLTAGFVDDGFVYLTETKADELRNANAWPGDIVITHRGTLGQVGLIPRNSRYPRYVVSQSQMVLAIDPDRATSRYVYEFLLTAKGQQALLANTSQVGVPAIARPTTSIKAIELIVPPPNLLAAYDGIAGFLFQRVRNALGESRSLGVVRDTLLPKLLSGELRVPVEDAACVSP